MNKITKVVSVSALLLISASGLFAQQTWTLRGCIDYARENNIQVQKSRIATEGYDVDISQSKAELFPSLSGSVSQEFNNAKNAQKNYKYESSFGGRYNLSANVVLYNGRKNLNNIELAKLNKNAEQLNTQYIQNNIEIEITQAYLQMLYSRESIKNNENTVASTKVQLDQSKTFLDAGSITMSDYAQVEAQYSSDKYNLVVAQNSFDNYKLQLKQLLELDYDVDFEPEFPDIDDSQVLSMLPAKEDIYRTALNIMPEIKSSEMDVQIAKLNKSSAKAGYLPTVSLSGSLGTANSWNGGTAYGTQLDRNFTQSVGLTVSIPIFDNKQTESKVRKANLDIQTSRLNVLDTRKTLLRTIESLYQDAVSAQSKYLSAKDKLKSAELSYTLVQEQFSLGLRNTVELTTEKTNHVNALQELLQAKYTALLSLKLLNFYQGQDITL
ncbi:outer membrane protein [Dysgonomonas sp. PH5-45]|uniref:TolC family protein n=1 Tax=unclassified Dysgonomonas TaxID=2630389 RepID=UPI00247521E6|nr:MULTISPECIES: TolC family protein [unclassified Dysgonomonas]MDH6354447.1 outer membrane protein [Dysgonomonas sp. PH5-45]MDH6387346.1 outer membrane protein [Dysgonomonas sp. PH5-37]